MSDIYFKQMKDAPPSSLLAEAIPFAHIGCALDMGAGPLNDARLLLEHGFSVTALDSAPRVAELVAAIGDRRLTAVTKKFDEFAFPLDTYDLINSQWSLSFNSPQTFSMMFSNMKRALRKDGIFCATIYGARDGWATARSDTMFFVNNGAELEDLLSGFDILKLDEMEEDVKNAHDNATKHWHVFSVIARKN